MAVFFLWHLHYRHFFFDRFLFYRQDHPAWDWRVHLADAVSLVFVLSADAADPISGGVYRAVVGKGRKLTYQPSSWNCEQKIVDDFFFRLWMTSKIDHGWSCHSIIFTTCNITCNISAFWSVYTAKGNEIDRVTNWWYHRLLKALCSGNPHSRRRKELRG